MEARAGITRGGARGLHLLASAQQRRQGRNARRWTTLPPEHHLSDARLVCRETRRVFEEAGHDEAARVNEELHAASVRKRT
jgi:hypothetical protein